MRKGTCAMTGFTLSTLQRFTMYCVVLAMSGLYQATRRYLRCLRWLANFSPATICLALAFVFSGTVGAVAQTAVPGPDQKVAPGAMVVLDGSASIPSPGNTISSYSWISTSTQADCDPAPSHPTSGVRISFTAEDLAPGAADVTYCFFMKVDQDNGDGSPWVPLNVTVSHSVMANTPPVAEAGSDVEVNSGTTPVPLDGRGSMDNGGSISTYVWARTGGTTGASGTLINADKAQASFTPDPVAAGAADVTHVFTLTVTDDDNATDTDMVTITVNAPPVANAGLDRTVGFGAPVTLDGSGSSDSTGMFTYAWVRSLAPNRGNAGNVTLTRANTATPTFTPVSLDPGAPKATYGFTLTVTDSDGVTAEDMVTISVIAPAANVDPVAEAGSDVEVNSGTTPVPLDGRGSMDNGGSIATYVWARTGGTTGASGTLLNADKAQASFTPDPVAAGAADVTHVFTLTVTDDDGATDTDMVTITVNAPPVANAGLDRTVGFGAPVTLDGSGSSDSTGTFTYAWMRSVAPNRGNAGNVTLTRANTATPTFTPVSLDPGAPDATYGFTLTVTDSDGVTAVAMVTITVTTGNLPPVAEAGADVEVNSGTTPVPLDGRGSMDNGGSIATYVWARTGGTTGASGTLINADKAQASFTPDPVAAGAADVTHVFTLTVTDDDGATDTDMVTITVNAPPVANAGLDRTVGFGAPVTLDGSGSSDTTGTLTYAWMRSVAPDRGDAGNVTLIGENTATPTFTPVPLDPGAPDVTYGFTLTVTDSDGVTAVAMVTITVTAGNLPPVAEGPPADAGPPLTVAPGALVQFDGPVSSDSGETIMFWDWSRTGGTGDSNVNLIGANTARPSFTAPALNPGDAAVTHVFTLRVTYEDGRTYTDTVTVTVSAVSVDIRVSDSVLTVQEGGSGTYRVSLGESPPQEVIIMATSGNEAVVQLKNARLVFNSGNWNEFQEVEINTVAGAGTENGTVRIRHSLVTAGVALDEPGDVIVTVRARADDPIPRPVGEFLAARATALINNQPGLSSFLELDGPTPGGGGSGSFTFQATDGRLALNGGFIHNGVWGKVSGSRASSESGDTKSVTKSVLGSFGIHRKYSEHVLAGAMLQFDLSDHDRAGQVGTTHTIDGTGWLAGPYFAARHDTRPVYFEGRLLYGQSDNDIRFIDPALGVRTGSFDTKRLLAQIRVEGEIAVSGGRDHGDDGGADGPRLRPYADARWIEDRAEAFTDNFGNRVPGQKVSIGQLELGSNVEVPIAVRTGAMTFTGGLGLVWSNTDGDYITSDSGGRGRGEIGFLYDLDDNLRIEFESFYDGIGSSRYEGYGLSLSAEMKF